MFKYLSILILSLILILYLQYPTVAQADLSLARGYAFSILHEYRNSLKQYESYIKANPNASQQYIAQNNKGNEYYYLGDFNQAVSAYSEAIKLGNQAPDSHIAIIHYNLANALIGLEEDQGNTNFELKENRIIEEYQKAIKLNPALLEAYNNLASIYSSQTSQTQNSESIDRAIKERQEKAIRYFEEALQSATKLPSGDLSKIATLHINLGNLMYQKISEEIRDLCEPQNPKNSREPNISNLRNPATERFGEEIEACKDDRECIQEAVRRWQETLRQQTSSQQQLTPREIESPSPTPDLPINLEEEEQKKEECLRQHFDKFTDAIRQYEMALKLRPNFVEAYNNLGNLYLELGKFEQAIAQFRKALTLDKKALFVHNNLGVAFFKSGRTEEGESEYKTVQELRKKFLAPRFLGQYIAMSDNVRGRVAERGLAGSQSMRLSSLRQ